MVEIPIDFDDQLIAAHKIWLERIKNPDFPEIKLTRGDSLTARQFVAEIEGRTEIGRRFLRTFTEFAMNHPELGPEGMLRQIRGESSEENK